MSHGQKMEHNFQYSLTAIWLFVTGKISWQACLLALKTRQVCVAGRNGSFVVDNAEWERMHGAVKESVHGPISVLSRKLISLAKFVDAESIGAGAGITGSLLVAMAGKYAIYGWILFGISNAAWLLFAVKNGYKKLAGQTVCFMATTALGFYNAVKGLV